MAFKLVVSSTSLEHVSIVQFATPSIFVLIVNRLGFLAILTQPMGGTIPPIYLSRLADGSEINPQAAANVLGIDSLSARKYRGEVALGFSEHLVNSLRTVAKRK